MSQKNLARPRQTGIFGRRISFEHCFAGEPDRNPIVLILGPHDNAIVYFKLSNELAYYPSGYMPRQPPSRGAYDSSYWSIDRKYFRIYGERQYAVS
jgi:hypothetical protein